MKNKNITTAATKLFAIAAISAFGFTATVPAFAAETEVRPVEFNTDKFQNNLQRYVSQLPRTGLKTKFEFTVHIDKFGEVTSISYTNDGRVDTETAKTLEEKAKKTIEKTKFTPKVVDGETVDSKVVIPVTFVI